MTEQQLFTKLVAALKAGERGSETVLADYLLEAGVPDHAAADLLHAITLGPSTSAPEAAAAMAAQGAVRQPEVQVRRVLDFYSIRPFVYFDTMQFDPARLGAFRCSYFRNLSELSTNPYRLKTEAHTNCMFPRRLPSGSALKLRRVSARFTEGSPATTTGVLELYSGLHQLLVCPLDMLLTPFGAPCQWELDDRDDLRCNVVMDHSLQSLQPRRQDTPYLLRVNLHGWLMEPIA